MDERTKELIQETKQLLGKSHSSACSDLKLPSVNAAKLGARQKHNQMQKRKKKKNHAKQLGGNSLSKIDAKSGKSKGNRREQDTANDNRMDTKKKKKKEKTQQKQLKLQQTKGRRSTRRMKFGEVPFGERVQKMGEFEAKNDQSYASLQDLKDRSKAKCQVHTKLKPKSKLKRNGYGLNGKCKQKDPFLSPAQKIAPIPFGKERSALGDREWENELARNILTLYHTSKAKEDEGRAKGKAIGKMQLERAQKRAKENIRLRQIWFAGTGVVPAVWCVLCREGDEVNDPSSPVFLSVGDTSCTHVLCKQLKRLEQQAKYFRYVTCVEKLLREYSEKNRAEDEEEKLEAEAAGEDESELGEELDIQEQRLWRQLIVCCNVFGVKLTEDLKFKQALEMLQNAEAYIQNVTCLDDPSAGNLRVQLRAYLWDSTAFYYFKRGKMNAAAMYTQKAMKAHVRLKQWEHIAKCHLHCGTILSMMKQHEASIECLNQVLLLVHEGKLEVGGTSAQKICMVAVCYHNIAVEQLLLYRPGEACVASQNARKLAKLSLSYSNRWIKTFEATHQAALTKLTKQTVHPSKAFDSTDLVQRIKQETARANQG